jgi:hypothetical protein
MGGCEKKGMTKKHRAGEQESMPAEGEATKV